jgi:hypothetical protein
MTTMQLAPKGTQMLIQIQKMPASCATPFPCALQAVENGREEPPSIFGDALIAEVCASHKRGLQLLLMDLSDFEDKFELPLSLRYIFLSNRQGTSLRTCEEHLPFCGCRGLALCIDL